LENQFAQGKYGATSDYRGQMMQALQDLASRLQGQDNLPLPEWGPWGDLTGSQGSGDLGGLLGGYNPPFPNEGGGGGGGGAGKKPKPKPRPQGPDTGAPNKPKPKPKKPVAKKPTPRKPILRPAKKKGAR
jgi:hypothetical protein